MIVVRPRQGERIPVDEWELDEINRIFDDSAGKWKKPKYVKELFSAANWDSKSWVYLRSEGWHQLEWADGIAYKHVTVHFNGWTYHCYTKVKGNSETPESGKHTIDCISYQTGKGVSQYLYPA